jgi:16S rRNA (guanine527-N7)-methyltransferase
MDVGTGGGFPGIPLAILFHDTAFHLVDSIGKKITVVKGVATALGLVNVKGEQIRVEQENGRYDFIVSRAVTRLNEFYKWVHRKVKPNSLHTLRNGILYLKGGNLTEELAEVNTPSQIFDLSDFFSEPFFETKKVVHVSV